MSTVDFHHKSQAVQYQYQQLPRHDCIRLLLLLPGEYEDTEIFCRLLSVPLEEAPPYEALSYVWGDPTNTVEIDCGRGLLKITKNLRDALRRLRWPTESRYLWADAACINQNDLAERGKQVGMMGLIYWHASRVIVWLGLSEVEPDDVLHGHEFDVGHDAADAFALITETTKMVYEQERAYGHYDMVPIVSLDDLLNYDAARWMNLAKLMDRKWFHRAWVIQEIGLAAQAWFVCGNSELHLTEYLPFIRWLATRGNLVCNYFGIDVRQQYLAGDYWLSTRVGATETPPDQLSFLEVLATARGVKCSNPMDHVYAFLGHPSAFQTFTGDTLPYLDYRSNYTENRKTIVQADYVKPLEEVYTELASNILRRTNSFDALSYVCHGEEAALEQYPSWVPVWDIGHAVSPLGVSDTFFYSASGSALPVFRISEDKMHVNGVFFDSVDWLTPVIYGVADGLSTGGSPFGKKSTRNPLEGVWHMYFQYAMSRSPALRPEQSSFSYALTAGLMDTYPAEDDPNQHEANMCAYRLQKATALGVNLGPHVLEGLRGKAESGDSSRFLTDLQLRAEGRVIFCTRHGHIGLGPSIMRRGDECWIVAGAKVPFILRQMGSDDGYKNIGEAYVHGIMRGEHMKVVSEKDFQEIMLC